MRPSWSGFLAASERYPDHAALETGARTWTYAALRDRAAGLAATLHGLGAGPWVAVVAQRSEPAFVGVLGAWLAGVGYLPVSPRLPAARAAELVDRGGARVVVLDAAGEALLPTLAGAGRVFVLPDRDPADLRGRYPADAFLGPADVLPASRWSPPTDDGEAWLLFTSGSTGRPKGVPVGRAQARAFLDAARSVVPLGPTDRASQLFDLGFDLSAFDLFAAWEAGATVVCPGPRDLLAPGPWAARERLTSWFSVPSQAALLRRMGGLAPGIFPDLRWSLFCGEALPTDLARAWASAAPGSAIVNLYGPTEVTVACTAHQWTGDEEGDLVPIGEPFGETIAAVLDEEGGPAAPGAPGELWLSGPQVARGYLGDPERTTAAFPIRADGRRWYRTGDLVRRDPGGPLRFLGRVDHQVKVRGHRVELGEVEAALREVCGARAVVLGWPRTAIGAEGLAAFVELATVDVFAVRSALRLRLPEVMVPGRIEAIGELPSSPNGKVDRGALELRLRG